METNRKTGKIEEWIRIRMSKSRFPVLKWLSHSLKRDHNFPLRWKFRRGVHFFAGMVAAKFYMRSCTKVGKRARTYDGRPYIDNAGTMIMGDDVLINCKNVRSDFVTRPNGLLEFGDRVFVNFGTSFVAEKHIKIGNGCQFGPYCFILDSNAHLTQGDRFEWAPGETIILEDNVWLGSRVIVMKGSTIGENSTIAAGSVVSGYIPPYTIAGGVPAKVLKYLRPPEGVKRPWVQERKRKAISPEIKKRVNKVIRLVFGLNEDPDEGQGLQEIQGWNSYKQLQVMEALENEFNIRYSNEDLVKMTKLNRLYEITTHQVKRQHELITVRTVQGK